MIKTKIGTQKKILTGILALGFSAAFSGQSFAAQASPDDNWEILRDREIQEAIHRSIEQSMVAAYPEAVDIHIETGATEAFFAMSMENLSEDREVLMQPIRYRDGRIVRVILQTDVVTEASRWYEFEEGMLRSVRIEASEPLTNFLEEGTHKFFIKEIVFAFQAPVDYELRFENGVHIIRFTEKAAMEERLEAAVLEKSDQVFRGVEDAFGEEYRATEAITNIFEDRQKQDYLSEVFSRGRTDIAAADFSYGVNERMAAEDFRQRYPKFGTFEYWKKHVRGVLANTWRYDREYSRDAGGEPDDAFVYEPNLALGYLRQGVVGMLLGYQIDTEMPFSNSRDFAKALGFNQNIRADFLYNPGKRYVLGWNSDILAVSNKPMDGTRETTYTFNQAWSARYLLSARDALSLSVGFSHQDNDGPQHATTGFINTGLIHQFSERLQGRIGYELRRDLSGISSPNRHTMNIETSYKWSDATTIGLRTRTEVVGRRLILPPLAEGVINFNGSISWSHNFTPRDSVTAGYHSNIAQDLTTLADTDEPLILTAEELEARGIRMVRTQGLSVSYRRSLSEKTEFSLNGTYSHISEVDGYKTPADGATYQFRLRAALLRQIFSNRFNAELSYDVSYSRSYTNLPRGISLDLERIKSSQSSHALFLRIIRYL